MKDYNLKQSAVIVAGGCGLLLVCLCLFTPLFTGSGSSKERMTQLEEAGLANAIARYATAYRHYPIGENADAIKALAGDNPQRTKFLNLRAGSTNEEGQLIDLWNMPYKISFDDSNSFTIASAGNNHIFGDRDDIVFKANSKP